MRFAGLGIAMLATLVLDRRLRRGAGRGLVLHPIEAEDRPSTEQEP